MIITFKNKQMIVTHESGVIDRFTKADVERWKQAEQEQAAAHSNNIIWFDFQIAQIENTS